MEVESMKKMKAIVEKCLEELSKKSDLTPAETEAALNGMKLRKELCEEIEDCEVGDYKNTDDMYSERSSYRRRHSYDGGTSSRGYSEHPRYGIGGWYQNSMNGNSMMPGYPVEHMNMSYCPPNYYSPDMAYSERRGYSRHSVSDRAVEQLEHMMDTTESDYERQELRKYIKMIRAAGLTD